jgi:hypothetical protein
LGGKCFSDEDEAEMEVHKWLRRQPKDFYAAGFEALLKQWDKNLMLVEDMSRNKHFLFFEYHIFYVLYSFVTYLLPVPYNTIIWHNKIK